MTSNSFPTRFLFTPEYERLSIDALENALASASFYGNWRKSDPGSGFSADRRYADLPILTKSDIRGCFPDGLVPGGLRAADGLNSGEIEAVQTSGTTEERVGNLWNQEWWNASERASWKLNDHTLSMDGTQPEALLATAQSVGVLSEEDLPMSARRLDRFLFLNDKISPRSWLDRHYERMIRELEEFSPVVLEANPSFLGLLAGWALDHGIPVFSPRVIVFTYELATSAHLRLIRRVFRSPLASSYGSTEAGYVFMECEHGKFHQNSAFCRVDFQPLKARHGGPLRGRILVTTFLNKWASLVRFDIGDLVTLDDAPECSCGRQEGIRLASIDGRLANSTFTAEGTLVTPRQLDDALAPLSGIRDYQLEQTGLREYTLRLVAENGSGSVSDSCRDALTELYGPGAGVAVEILPALEPSPSGKYRRCWTDFRFDAQGLFDE